MRPGTSRVRSRVGRRRQSWNLARLTLVGSPAARLRRNSALKELQIDEKLAAISDDWSDEQLTFANFKNRGMICLKGGETGELIEKGEETLMALGSMMASCAPQGWN